MRMTILAGPAVAWVAAVVAASLPALATGRAYG